MINSEQYEYDAFWVAYASVNNVEAVTNAQSKKKLNIKKAKWSEADTWNSDEIVIDNIRYKRYNGKGKIGNTRLYTGREYDAEIQLYYNRARYYSPDLGRFINRDPIDVADDVNLYAYVGNNGVMFVDRMGLEKVLIILWIDHEAIYPIFDKNWYIINSEDSYIYIAFNLLRDLELGSDIKVDYILVNTFEEFDNAINEKEREEIYVIAHWSKNSISLDSSSIFNWNETKINKSNLNNDDLEDNRDFSNTSLTLLSCSTWQWENSIWEQLQNYYNFKETTAPSGTIRPWYVIYDKIDKHEILSNIPFFFNEQIRVDWFMKTFY